MKKLSFVIILSMLLVLSTVAMASATCSISITSPVGGENWSGIHDITWSHSGDSCSATTIQSIIYSLDSGSTWNDTSYVGSSLYADDDSWSWSTSEIIDSTNVRIRITSNGGSSSESLSDFTVDNTPSSISISDDSSSSWVNSDTISVSVTDATSGVKETKWILRTNSTCDSTIDSDLNSSSHLGTSMTADDDSIYQNKYICFRTEDNAGNYNYSVSSQITKLDTTKPTIDAGSDETKKASFSKTATISDSASGVNTSSYQWTQVSGHGTITFGSANALTTTISADTDGTYVVQFQAKDNAGNTEKDNFTLIWDASQPTISFTDDVENGWVTSEDVTVNASFDVSGKDVFKYAFILDTASCNSSVTFSTDINDGDTISILDNSTNGHDICFYLKDLAGNEKYSRTSNKIQVDTTNPSITITDDASASWVSSDDLKATMSDSESGINNSYYKFVSSSTSCDNNLSGSTAYTSGSTVSITTTHNDYVCFQSEDKVGNINHKVSAQLHVDKTVPTISNVVIVPSDPSNDNTPVITFNVYDAESGVDSSTIKLFDGTTTFTTSSAELSCTSSGNNYSCTMTYSSALSDGDYDFKIDANDDVGNSATQYTISAYTIDTTAPKGSIARSLDVVYDGNLNTQVVNIYYNETMDTNTSPNISFDQGTFTSNGNGVWVNNSHWRETFSLTDNDEEFAIVKISSSGAKDLAGNLENSSIAQFKIDTKNPTVSSVDSDGSSYFDGTSSPVTIKITFSEDLSTAPSVSISPNGSSQTVGDCGDADDKTFCFDYAIPQDVDAIQTINIDSAKDDAGNEMVLDNSHTFDVDTRNPVIVSAIASPNPAKDGTVTVNITFSESMDTSLNPTVTVEGLASSSYAVTKTSFSGNNWLGTFTLLDDNEDLNGTISVTGNPKDLAGNLMSDNTSAGLFAVDTITPVSSAVEIAPNQVRSGSQFSVTAHIEENNFKKATAYLYNSTGDLVANVSTTQISDGLVNFVFAGTYSAGTYKMVVLGEDTAGNSEVESNINRETFEMIEPLAGDPVITSFTLNKTTGVIPGEIIRATCSATFTNSNNSYYEINGVYDADGVMDIVAAMTDGSHVVTCKAIDGVNSRFVTSSVSYTVGAVSSGTAADLITYIATFGSTSINNVKVALDWLNDNFDNYYDKTASDARYYTKTAIDSMFSNYYTKTELNAGQLDNRYYTESEVDAGFQPLDADLTDLADGTLSKSKVEDSSNWDLAYAERGSQIAGDHLSWDGSDLNVADDWFDSLSDLKTAVGNDFHNLGGVDADTTYVAGQGLILSANVFSVNTSFTDALYYLKSKVYNKSETYSKSEVYNKSEVYTKTELDAGQLDNRYYTESEVDAGFSSLEANISSERLARIANDSALENGINSESSRALAAEASLNSSLNSEVSRASSAEASINNSLNNEISNRQNNDTNLQSQITSLENRVVDDVQGIQLVFTRGWNTFHLPSFVLTGTGGVANISALNISSDYSVSNVLSSINGSYTYISYYDGNSWKIYEVNGTQTFTEFPHAENNPDYLYYIYMTSPATATINLE